jgi:hypothetical protein
MRIHRNLIWLSFILGSIFLWYVYFQHGTSAKGFWYGLRQELSDGFSWMAERIEKKTNSSGLP